MRRRPILTLAATAALLGSFGAMAAQASPAPVEAPRVGVAAGYWACVAVDHVEVGACVGNPFPSFSELA